jgi:predicted enzyme related to lactoylglutathione lyase
LGQPVAFFEVIRADHERAQKFYAELFAWQIVIAVFADPDGNPLGLRA